MPLGRSSPVRDGGGWLYMDSIPPPWHVVTGNMDEVGGAMSCCKEQQRKRWEGRKGGSEGEE